MADLLTPDGKSIISTADLRLKYGHKAGPAQRRALTRLTLMLTSADTVPLRPLLRRTKGLLAPLPAPARRIHPTHLLSLRRATADYLETSPVNTIANNQRYAPPHTVQNCLEAARGAPPTRKTDQVKLDLTKPCRKRKTGSGTDYRRATLPPTPDKDTALPPDLVLTREERARRQYNPEAVDIDPDPSAARAALAHAGCAHTVTTITGQRIVTVQHRKVKGAAGSERQSQRQYLVEWSPTLEETWSLHAYQVCGYTPIKQTKVTFQALSTDPALQPYYDMLKCEVCNEPHDETTLLVCDTCHRMYHTHCIAGSAPEPADGDVAWSCNYCSRLERQRECRRPKQREQALWVVHWEPSWEPADNIPNELVEE